MVILLMTRPQIVQTAHRGAISVYAPQRASLRLARARRASAHVHFLSKDRPGRGEYSA
jgi:hypothetical protein